MFGFLARILAALVELVRDGKPMPAVLLVMLIQTLFIGAALIIAVGR